MSTTRTNARQQRMRQQVLEEEKQEQQQQQKRQAASKLIISSSSSLSANNNFNGSSSSLGVSPSGTIAVPINSSNSTTINGGSTLFATLNGGGDTGQLTYLMSQHRDQTASHQSIHNDHVSLSAPNNSTMHQLLLSSSVPTTGVTGFNIGSLNLATTGSHSPASGAAHSLGTRHSGVLQSHLNPSGSRTRSISHSVTTSNHPVYDVFEVDNTLSPSGEYSPTDNSNASDVKSPIDSAFANIPSDQQADELDWSQIEPSLNANASNFTSAVPEYIPQSTRHNQTLGPSGSQPGNGSIVKPSTSCPANMTSPYTPGGTSIRVSANNPPPAGFDLPVNLNEDQKLAWMRDRNKKDSHNRIERKRRDYINSQITELGTLLPDELFRDNDCKKNKGSILKNSVEYILNLRHEANLSESLRQETQYAEEAILKLFRRVQDFENFIKQEAASGRLSQQTESTLMAGSSECTQNVREWFNLHQINSRELNQPVANIIPTGGSSAYSPQQSQSVFIQSNTGGHTTSQSLRLSNSKQHGLNLSTNQNQQIDSTMIADILNHAEQPNERELAYFSIIKTEPPMDIDMDTGCSSSDPHSVTLGGSGPDYDPVLSAFHHGSTSSLTGQMNLSSNTNSPLTPGEYKYETPME